MYFWFYSICLPFQQLAKLAPIEMISRFRLGGVLFNFLIFQWFQIEKLKINKNNKFFLSELDTQSAFSSKIFPEGRFFISNFKQPSFRL